MVILNMNTLVKVCKIHGELPSYQIRKEKNKSYKNGYQLKCRFCDREKNKRQYLKKVKHNNASWGTNKDWCSIHGSLNKEDISLINEERNKSGYEIVCSKCLIGHKKINGDI